MTEKIDLYMKQSWKASLLYSKGTFFPDFRIINDQIFLEKTTERGMRYASAYADRDLCNRSSIPLLSRIEQDSSVTRRTIL